VFAFDTIVSQAISRRFHRRVDDALLDRCAAECGCVPIGRMCLLDDAAAAEVIRRTNIVTGKRVLDFGCGRGFLGRWLDAEQAATQYSAVDRIEGALEATRKHVPNGRTIFGDFRAVRWRPEFDGVVALEIATGSAIDESVVEAAASALKRGGIFALTLASLDGKHAVRIAALSVAAEKRFRAVDVADWTQRVAPFARRTYQWWLAAPWHCDIAQKCRLEANAALDALERGTFHYAVLFARR